MTPLTVIPDIHADPDRLYRGLAAAGDGRVALLGDLIDAGHSVAKPDDREVLRIVRRRIEDGRAVAIMGNHELNAILFHRTAGSGENEKPLRSREPKNAKQHESFCDAFGVATRDALDWTSWFLELPLWLEMDGLRLVHACWNRSAIKTVGERRPDGRLKEEDLEEVAAKTTEFARAVNLLLTGPELALPPGISFHDKGGHKRHHARIAWWRSHARTWRRASLSIPKPDELPDEDIESFGDLDFYRDDEPPVLVGHYKMLGAPCIESPKAACLDYPDAPCVYHWSGGGYLEADDLEIV
ncbi:metallophosphoesterase [Paragemmobacter straminiformis]|uniref:Calcineurin-like phosphoesterase domain-containing protein n=1 Tax=Paragemmobacter straminiformis TaxID=2045119 RepID=A0A842I2X4_9RHOB|nr:metallophosphoesterase [Gemmobacter straminiformis]MBC2834079.1 hypothetical protein [Gemmobacter straminiformis]